MLNLVTLAINASSLYGTLPAFVVTTAGQSELGVNFPETGIYVLNDGNDGTDEGYAIQEAPKTPIDYLYNGVQLPDINTVWTDKETYPYAVMSNAPESVSIQNAIGLADQVYQLMVSSSPTAVKSSGSGYRYHVSDAVAKRYIVLVNSAELDALMTENNVTDEDLETALGVSRRGWLLKNEYDLYEAGFAIDSRPTNWANHDILNEDGSTYLAASEPVPVYE